MPFKKGDFVELEYTGKVKETGQVFDTTDEKLAKEAGVFNERAEYKPIVICIGENHILKGIDEFLVGKDVGEHKVDLPAELAFGKKNPEFIRMIPVNKFTEHKINPVPGLNVNVDGAVGVVKTVSGGRCIVDFNHPLASQEVSYELKVNKVVTDKQVQLDALVKLILGVQAKVEVKEKKGTITLPAKLPDTVEVELAKKLGELTGLEVSFVEEKAETKSTEEKKS